MIYTQTEAGNPLALPILISIVSEKSRSFKMKLNACKPQSQQHHQAPYSFSVRKTGAIIS